MRISTISFVCTMAIAATVAFGQSVVVAEPELSPETGQQASSEVPAELGDIRERRAFDRLLRNEHEPLGSPVPRSEGFLWCNSFHCGTVFGNQFCAKIGCMGGCKRIGTAKRCRFF